MDELPQDKPAPAGSLWHSKPKEKFLHPADQPPLLQTAP